MYIEATLSARDQKSVLLRYSRKARSRPWLVFALPVTPFLGGDQLAALADDRVRAERLDGLRGKDVLGLHQTVAKHEADKSVSTLIEQQVGYRAELLARVCGNDRFPDEFGCTPGHIDLLLVIRMNRSRPVALSGRSSSRTAGNRTPDRNMIPSVFRCQSTDLVYSQALPSSWQSSP